MNRINVNWQSKFEGFIKKAFRTTLSNCFCGLLIRKAVCLFMGIIVLTLQLNARTLTNYPATDIDALNVSQQHLTLQSPNKDYKILVDIGDSITYALYYKGKKVVRASRVGLTLQTLTLGSSAKILHTSRRKVATKQFPVHGDFEELADKFNELTVAFKGDYSIVFRAYNEGVAYRFKTAFKDSIRVIREQADFKLVGPATADIAMTDNLTAWELPYQQYNSLQEIPDSLHAITPALFSIKQPACRVIIAEADVRSYPGMYLRRKGDELCGYWAAYPKRSEMGSWGNFVSVVKEREGYIAISSGTHAFPWRVIIATDNDGSLLTNNLIYLLAAPSKLADTKWIKPGKATWEWWHDAILPGATIASGMDNRNTTLYNYYVDFAGRQGLEYLMIDAGWSNVYDIKKPNPKIDIKEVIGRAKSKNVGVFLWCVANSLLNDLPGNLDYLKELGAKGLKVDFFDRDDQVAAMWMENIAKEAAKRHLLIDFHGCTKPSGLDRTYPNIVNYEALRGAECDKWDTTANPRHHLTVPFIRMLAGPIDYTPGAMRNKSKSEFKPIGAGLPSAMGTRCHELAMYILFNQPLAMLCDAPSVYEQYPDILHYLSNVPTTFADTKVLGASVGNYAILAKRRGKDWYVGAMTNWSGRSVQLDFSFLPKGKKFNAVVFKDGPNADKIATDYVRQEIVVTHASKMEINLASGGGAVLHLTPFN